MANKKLNLTKYSRTLAVSNWVDNYQTINISALTPKTYTMVTPKAESVDDYTSCGIVNVSKDKGTLTFQCSSVPENNVQLTITVWEGYEEGEEYIPESPKIYGVYWDGSVNSSMLRTDDAALFIDPSPAVNNGDGWSPFDNILPWSGMELVEDSEAGTLVSIPKFWYKWTRDETTTGDMKLQIANYAVDGFLVSPAHADRGDGKGERDVVYVGAYHCSSSDYKSTTGVTPKASITKATARTSISALGSTIWQWDYAILWTIRMLYLVEYASWDSQSKIGYGCGNNSSIENTGLCDSMIYHTGTNAASLTNYGHVRYRYIEDLWANVRDYIEGIYFSDTTIYCIKNPNNFSDTTGGTNVGTRHISSNVISRWTNPTTNGFEYALYPSEISSADYTTYICDRTFYDSSGITLTVGGAWDQGLGYGLFASYGNITATTSNAKFSTRLMKLP